MSDSNNNSSEGEPNPRTDSNLPILFANGYPTSLEKMAIEQLERFLPFLVKCSRNGSEEDKMPEWWLNEIELKSPLEKPKTFKKVKYKI